MQSEQAGEHACELGSERVKTGEADPGHILPKAPSRIGDDQSTSTTTHTRICAGIGTVGDKDTMGRQPAAKRARRAAEHPPQQQDPQQQQDGQQPPRQTRRTTTAVKDLAGMAGGKKSEESDESEEDGEEGDDEEDEEEEYEVEELLGAKKPGKRKATLFQVKWKEGGTSWIPNLKNMQADTKLLIP